MAISLLLYNNTIYNFMFDKILMISKLINNMFPIRCIQNKQIRIFSNSDTSSFIFWKLVYIKNKVIWDIPRPMEYAELIVAALKASSIFILHKIQARCITNGIEKHGAKFIFENYIDEQISPLGL